MPTRRRATAWFASALFPLLGRMTSQGDLANTCPEDPPIGYMDGPPRAVLRAPSGACQTAGRLGFCWACNGGAICTGGSGGAPGTPLLLATDQTAEIRLGHLGRIAQVDIKVWPRSSPATGPLPFRRSAEQPIRTATLRRPRLPIVLTSGLPPGDYTIDVKVRVRGRCGGETSEAFRIRVEDAGPIAIATPTPGSTPVPAH